MAKNNIKARAFLLDSSFDWAAMVKQTMHKHQIELVEWNRTGKGWPEVFKQRIPDLMIIDNLLTKRDAFECMRSLNALNLKPYIIFTHSYCGIAANGLEQKALAAGADSVLQKPFSEHKLSVSLERALLSIGT